MDAAAEIGRNPVRKHQIQPEYGDEQADAGRDGRIRLARPNSQVRTRTGKYSFSVELTTSRIGNLTRLIHTLAICVTIHTYIHRCHYLLSVTMSHRPHTDNCAETAPPPPNSSPAGTKSSCTSFLGERAFETAPGVLDSQGCGGHDAANIFLCFTLEDELLASALSELDPAATLRWARDTKKNIP